MVLTRPQQRPGVKRVRWTKHPQAQKTAPGLTKGGDASAGPGGVGVSTSLIKRTPLRFGSARPRGLSDGRPFVRRLPQAYWRPFSAREVPNYSRVGHDDDPRPSVRARATGRRGARRRPAPRDAVACDEPAEVFAGARSPSRSLLGQLRKARGSSTT
jgi:hypothetical protein